MFRYALVDFGLAQGTADTQIELLKVVRNGSLHKGDGSTGKQDNTQRSKAAAKVPPKTSTASTSAARPQQQHAPLPSSPSTASSSASSRKAPAKKAQSVTVNVPTATSCAKHTKVSALYRVLLYRWVFRRVRLMVTINELGNMAEEMGNNKTFCLIHSVFFFQGLTTLGKTARPVFGERNLNSCAPAASSTKPAVSKTEVSKVESGGLEYKKAKLEHPPIVLSCRLGSCS